MSMGPFLSAPWYRQPLRCALIHFLIWKKNFETVHFCTFCFSGFDTSLTLFSDFPQSGFSLSFPTHPPLLSQPSIPLSSLPFTPCRIVSLTELFFAQSQTAWAKPNTQGGSKTHTYTHTLTPPIIH